MQVNPEIGHDGFELVRDWGLTRSEAIAQSDADQRHSMIAFPILHKTDSLKATSGETLDSQDAIGVVFIHVMSDVSRQYLSGRFGGSKSENIESRVGFLNQILELQEYPELVKEVERLNKLVRFDQKAFGVEGA
jgi:hypothetical protein